MQKVRSGQKLNIPASDYNAFVDAAMAHKKNKLSGGPINFDKPFWALITGSAVAGDTSNKQWVYSIAKAVFTRSTPGGYPAVSALATTAGGISVASKGINRLELNNHNATGSTIAYGNGVYPDQLDPDGDETDEFSIVAVPDNTLVLVTCIRISGGSTPANGGPMYIFSHPNPISGACD